MGDDESCNTRLHLGLGIGEYVAKEKVHQSTKGLTFGVLPKDEGIISINNRSDGLRVKKSSGEDDDFDLNCEKGERKKLRLTIEQSALLEDSFKLHSTLNPAQKQLLAQQLNLKPRQVEVWFQNRRARTKLKQTEIDCEVLKKHCEGLREENRRLKKEVQELRSTKVGSSPFNYLQLPKSTNPTFTRCPSCQKIIRTNN